MRSNLLMVPHCHISVQLIFSQIDEEGRSFLPFLAMASTLMMVTVLNVNDILLLKGGSLIVKWRMVVASDYHSRTWTKSYPTQVAEYAVVNKIADEPAFRCWWIKHVLKKLDSLISEVKSCYWKKVVKYGIKLPQSVKKLSLLTGIRGLPSGLTRSWKRWRMSCLLFQILEEGESVPVGYKYINCHMIFSSRGTACWWWPSDQPSKVLDILKCCFMWWCAYYVYNCCSH